jgi:hypothetical protein
VVLYSIRRRIKCLLFWRGPHGHVVSCRVGCCLATLCLSLSLSLCMPLCLCLYVSLCLSLSLSLSGGDTHTLLLFVIVALAHNLNVAVDVAAKRKTHFANFYEKREKETFSGMFVRRLQLMSELLLYRS